jgi:hypothetical protein
MHSTIERPDHDDTELQTAGAPAAPGNNLTTRPSSVRRPGTSRFRFAVFAAFAVAAVVAIVAVSVIWRSTRAGRTSGAATARVENTKSDAVVPALVELPPMVDLTDAARVPALVELPPMVDLTDAARVPALVELPPMVDLTHVARVPAL